MAAVTTWIVLGLLSQAYDLWIAFHGRAGSRARSDMWTDIFEYPAPDGFGYIVKGKVNDVGYRAITVPDFPCRDQNRLFKREIEWIRRCQRTPASCAAPRCMHGIGWSAVLKSAEGVLAWRASS